MMLCLGCAGMAFSGWFLERKLGGDLESLQERQVCRLMSGSGHYIAYAASDGALADDLVLPMPVGGAPKGDSHELGASFCEDWAGTFGLHGWQKALCTILPEITISSTFARSQLSVTLDDPQGLC